MSGKTKEIKVTDIPQEYLHDACKQCILMNTVKEDIKDNKRTKYLIQILRSRSYEILLYIHHEG